MILLHLLLAGLYTYAAWALWPRPVHATAGGVTPRTPQWTANAPLVIPAALLLHAIVIASDVANPRGLDLNLGNALSLVAALTAIVAWTTGLMRTLPIVASVLLPIAAVFSLVPLLLPEQPHPFAYSEAPWASAHVAVALLAYSLFIVAAVQALVLMWLEKRLHRGVADTSTAVPPLLTLERLLFRLVTLGFLLLTLTLISGIFFSEALFGKPLTFSHKSLFSILAWLVFGALLLGRRVYGWRGRVALRWILTGTVLLILAYLGTKFVLEVLLHR